MAAGARDGDIEAPAGQRCAGDVVDIRAVQYQKGARSALSVRLPAQVAHAAEISLALLADIGDQYRSRAANPQPGGAAFHTAAMRQQGRESSAVIGNAGPEQPSIAGDFNFFRLARREHGIEMRRDRNVRPVALARGDRRSTLPARSILASQPSARNGSDIHSARFCSKNVGAGMRQSLRCCSLIQPRSRRNQSSAERTEGVVASSATLRASTGINS